MATPTVLVVDDSPAQRTDLAHVLRGAGFDVREAATGAAALRLAGGGGVSLVLLGVPLPDVSGYEVCRRLEADLATATLPVVLV